jgi:hypothetical protein
MPVYRIDVQIAGTAYIKADSEAEAAEKAKTLNDTTLMLQNVLAEGENEVPISGRQFNDPDLPEISLSPAMSCHGVWPGATLEDVDA